MSVRPSSGSVASTRDTPRFITRQACQDVLAMVDRVSRGGGGSWLSIESDWTGNLRWARNQIISSGDVRTTDLWLSRTLRGAISTRIIVNRLDTASLQAAVRRAERFLQLGNELPPDIPVQLPPEPYKIPNLWSDVTYDLDATHRTHALPALLNPTREAGMSAAGYLTASAHGRSVLDSDGLLLYFPYTATQYSVTVRSPDGNGSGWAGVDHYDWTKVDAEELSARALDKCLRSRNPVAVEPGRYMTILEPQAVCDVFRYAIRELDRVNAEGGHGPYAGVQQGLSKIGLRLLDERLTISADPMDPECGFPPFSRDGEIYHPVRWFEHGVLRQLSYNREYGIRKLGKNTGLPNSEAFRMSGGTTSLEEMIETTKRGIYVTRFVNIFYNDLSSLTLSGYTSDGTWLIENGKISKAIKNFRFTESPFFFGNQIVQLGTPRRVFHPSAPVVVPSMKVHEFSFTQLSDAI